MQAAFTADAHAAFAAAAVMRGVVLIGVLKGFTRGVFGLGRVMKDVIDRLKGQGVDPYSPEAGVDLKTVTALLRRALHLADALRVRLKTPAVALAMIRRGLRRRYLPRRDAVEEVESAWDDPLWFIAYRRTEDKLRGQIKRAIAEMSDGEVIDMICSDLLCASALLGETEEGARIAVLARKAAAAFTPAPDPVVSPDKVVPDEVARAPAERVMADACPAWAEMSDTRPLEHAMGRGPP